MELIWASKEEQEKITEQFVKSLESFSVLDQTTNTLQPVICSVCDSMPHYDHWHCFVDIKKASRLFERCKLSKSEIADEYPDDLIQQYTAKHASLSSFVLSPRTFVNDNEEVLICKSCIGELEIKYKCSNPSQPQEAIANNYLIGDAPIVLTDLSEVELSLISVARVYCQSWTFFAGCHQHIKGWHTFYKNRACKTVGNLMQLEDAGMQGSILVVLCGPFTSTQKAKTYEKTKVDKEKVVKAYAWLVNHNIHYDGMTIPNVNDIPQPKYLFENL